MSIDKLGSANAYQPPFVASQAGSQSAASLPVPEQPGDRPSADLSSKAVHNAVDIANKRMESQSALVRFNVTQESGRTIVRLVDTQTKQVLLQIPNVQMLRIAQNLDQTQGLAIQKQA
jgi:flagellar protein FlaG